jgi:NAD(P)H dehydrogenase (quinone)
MSACLQPLKSCFLGTPKEDQAAVQQKSNTTTTTTTAEPAQKQTPLPAITNMATAKIAVLVYSMYGHAAKLAEHAVEGLKEVGVEYKVYQIPETLPADVLGKMHAHKAPIESFPEVQPDDLKAYDGFIFAFPTRYGRAPAQVSAFFDRTGGLWASGALIGKFGTIITSTAR